jgi:predicted adenylyl cyclase CyaB
MKETEIKLIYKNKSVVVSLLKKSGFLLKKNRKIKDTYFGKNINSMTNKNQLVRIRQIENESTELTLKDKLQDESGIWTRREINVPINDAGSMENFLEALEYKKIRENSSEREIWEKDGIKVEFISYETPAKLDFMEVESENKSAIDKLVKLLGNEVKTAGEELFAVFDEAR